MSAVFAAIGLLREGFLLGGEADEEEEECEECDAAEDVGGEDLLAGTGTARVTATGLTAVGEIEPCEAWSYDTRRVFESLLYTNS